MKDFLHLPASPAYVLTNANLHNAGSSQAADGELTEIYIKDGLISAPHDGPVVDLEGAMVLPAFIDMHTHLDKGHIWPRAPNPDGTFASALATVLQDRTQNWKADDVRRRMEFALRCAYAHGTRAVRTHLDSASPQHRISWPIFDEVRADWSGRIDLQAVTILGIDAVDDDGEFQEIAETAARYGGVLGCVTYPVPDLERRLDIFFTIASRLGPGCRFSRR